MFLCLDSDIFRDNLCYFLWIFDQSEFLIILLMPKKVRFVPRQEVQSAFDQFKQVLTSPSVRALQNLSLLRLMHSAT